MVTEQSRSVEGNCLDFRADSSLAGGGEELWAPEGYFWYGDELIPIYPTTLTQEERLEILDSHPIFTGKCPQCGYELDPTARMIH